MCQEKIKLTAKDIEENELVVVTQVEFIYLQLLATVAVLIIGVFAVKGAKLYFAKLYER